MAFSGGNKYSPAATHLTMPLIGDIASSALLQGKTH